MCLLILLRGADPDFPLIVASNRDEHRERKASPPGLFLGVDHRILSPRDRVAGGTWMALNDQGMFAAITNLAGVPERPLETSRGELPHLAVDQSDVTSGMDAVRARCRDAEFNAFQLVVADGDRARVAVAANGTFDEIEIEDKVAVMSNEHRLGELVLPVTVGREAALEDRTEVLKEVLRDEGERTGHRILKKGGEYGTVSSSILAVPAGGLSGLQWWYAAGEPDVVRYRDYGNLARRLRDDL
jgi:uncharacterized protein with NRDE domain